jgi:hypothetical protein
MSFGEAKSPTGGVVSRCVVEEHPLDPVSVSGFTIRLRPDNFREPLGADPHAGWWGEGRFDAVPYPISPLFLPLNIYTLVSLRMQCPPSSGRVTAVTTAASA